MAIAILSLFFTSNTEKNKILNERITFGRKDKIPYGTYVAYENLRYLFPQASLSSSAEQPGYWDSLSNFKEGQALIIISPRFDADEFEMKKILYFAESGNDVFISTTAMPYEVTQILGCKINTSERMMQQFLDKDGWDTLQVSLHSPPYDKKKKYSYPGKRYDAAFSKLEAAVTTELGYDDQGAPNFIHLKSGKGNLYIHLAPMTFTNYFLLHRQNMAYYENVMSVIPSSTKKIVWDEYFLSKRPTQNKRPNWFTEFMKHDEFRWGFLTAMFALLIYVLMEMRRKQRPIPLITRPKNDSLDFIKTIGRLYYDKGDHKNLSRKMSAYFLEHVRTRYKLATNELDENFIESLQFKTGFDEDALRSIVYFINELEHLPAVSSKQLAAFYKQLENFYTKT
jgi:hypothetical protein